MRKVYFDNSAGNCVSIYMKDAEVIPAGVSIYSMPVSAKNREYERYAKEYDIHFIFDGSLQAVDFYAVPLIDIFAADSCGGFIGTVRKTTDFKSEASICYINKDRNIYIVAESGKEFLQRVSAWKAQMRLSEEVKIYASRAKAEQELEFIGEI